MKTLEVLATLVLTFVPFAAVAAECNGDHVADTLLCPGALCSPLPGGGCVISG